MTSNHTSWPLLRINTPNSGIEFRPVDQLIYLESELNYTWLYWTDGQRTLSSRTLKWLDSHLPPTEFIRIHRGYIVNQLFIHRFLFLPNQAHLYLLTGECLPIARRKRRQLRQQFKQKIQWSAVATHILNSHNPTL